MSGSINKILNDALDQTILNESVELEEGLAGDAYIPSSGISGAGLLPIQIEIPISGQIYRFARTIINPKDPLEFSVLYLRAWTISLIKWLIFIFAILIIYLNRRRLLLIWEWITHKLNPLVDKMKKQEIDINIKKYVKSLTLPLILLLLVFIFAMISIQLTLFFFILFLVSCAYYIFLRFEKKEPKRRKPKKS